MNLKNVFPDEGYEYAKAESLRTNLKCLKIILSLFVSSSLYRSAYRSLVIWGLKIDTVRV